MLPFAVIVLAILLGGSKPYLAAVGFLIGIFLSYFVAGVVIALGAGDLIQRVSAALVHWFKHPNAIDYILSIVIGSALITVGYRWAVARQARAERKQPTDGMSPLKAFAVGGGATIAGLWGALPYFAGIDQILKADVSDGDAVIALAFYNVVFISLPAGLVLIRALVGSRANTLFEIVNQLIAVWGKRVLVVALILLGAVMVADGVGWLFGRPLIPTG